jgi:hypothetical protein
MNTKYAARDITLSMSENGRGSRQESGLEQLGCFARRAMPRPRLRRCRRRWRPPRPAERAAERCSTPYVEVDRPRDDRTKAFELDLGRDGGGPGKRLVGRS